ncbi:TPA: HigA family addiction module antidote protein [Enterobacter hormaechei subsp. xiangfangensis]|nr:HigA family addiction module antidote protein [Enterobacter hormaechei subsp. xiangfangensis]HAV1890591.1 HigA family addiction module antidote protein [Enterobacter hormaechei subsp. xiangfangensis]
MTQKQEPNVHKHPGEIIKEMAAELDVTPRRLALALDVSPSTLQRVINGQSAVSPEMALRLEHVLLTDSLEWLIKQAEWDLQKARESVDVTHLPRIRQK